jgi:ribonuclease Z
MEMEVVCLGTASAVPSKMKNHSGFLVKTEKHKILVDCGEGIQRQFKFAEEPVTKLTHLLITHWHEDHSIGLFPLLKSMGMNNYSQTLQIYGPRTTKEKIDLLQKIYSKYKINVKVNEIISKLVYEDNDLKIEAEEMDHGIETLAYNIILKDKIRIDKSKIKKLKLPNSPLIGQLQQGKDIKFNNKTIKSKSVTYIEKGKKLTIILDTAMNQNAVKMTKDSDLLICESTYSKEESEQAKEYKHLTTIQAAEIAKKAKAKRLALVHISDKHLHRTNQLLKEAKSIFKNTSIPEDLQKIKI